MSDSIDRTDDGGVRKKAIELLRWIAFVPAGVIVYAVVAVVVRWFMSHWNSGPEGEETFGQFHYEVIAFAFATYCGMMAALQVVPRARILVGVILATILATILALAVILTWHTLPWMGVLQSLAMIGAAIGAVIQVRDEQQ